MFSRLNLTAKGSILVLVPVLFELIFVGLITLRLNTYVSEFERLERANSKLVAVLNLTSDYGSLMANAMMNGKTITNADMSSTNSQLEKLNSTSTLSSWIDLRESREIWDSLSELFNKFFKLISGLTDGGTPEELRKLQLTAAAMYPEMRQGFKALSRIETQVSLVGPRELERLNYELAALIAVGICFNIFLSILLAYLFTSDIVQRLQTITANAALLALEKPLREAQPGTDEIAELDRVVHDSAHRLIQSRQKQSAILSNVTDVICSLTRTLKLNRASKVLEKAWQYTEDELRGRSILMLTPEDSVAKMEREFSKLVETEATGEIETIVRCRNGAEKNTIWRVNWSRPRDAFFCLVHDVTAIRAVQQFRRKFLTMVSHDLRSPLTSVSISLSSLEESKKLSQAAVNQIRHMRAEASTVAQLVNEFLSLEKVLSGRVTYKQECVSVFDVCEEAIESVAAQAQAAKVAVDRADGEGAVIGDERALVDCASMMLRSCIRRSQPGARLRIHVSKNNHQVTMQLSGYNAPFTDAKRSALLERTQVSQLNAEVVDDTSWFDLIKIRAMVQALKGKLSVDGGSVQQMSLSIVLPEFVDEE